MSTGPLRLELLSETGEGMEVLDGDILGRGSVGRHIFETRSYVSRLHAQFALRDGHWTVTDLNSRNGTFLDGQRIAPFDPASLCDGQTIGFTRRCPLIVRLTEQTEAGDYIDQRVSLAVMFVDLRGSTEYFQKKGTIIGRNWIYRFYEMLKAEVGKHNGRHIKNIGDASLMVFPNAVQASSAAIAIQKAIREQNKEANPEDRYFLKIGINMGKVIFENDDVFGNTVNIASRVQSITPPGDIYFTATMYNHIKNTRAFKIEYVCTQELKGVKEKKKIYRLKVE